jgi:sodium-independent sulfate anion transporter 11
MLLGTSRDVTYGPTAVMSLLTAEFGHYPGVIGNAKLAILLAFVNGVVQIIMCLTRIGTVVT